MKTNSALPSESSINATYTPSGYALYSGSCSNDEKFVDWKPFLLHLESILFMYESYVPDEMPLYEGPRNQHTDNIIKCLVNMAKRMQTADMTKEKDRPGENLLGNEVVEMDTAGTRLRDRTVPHRFPRVTDRDRASATATEHDNESSAVEELNLLREQVKEVTRVCQAIADGDLSHKITISTRDPTIITLKCTINSMVERLGQFTREAIDEASDSDKLCAPSTSLNVQGVWKELLDALDRFKADFTQKVRCIGKVTKAVALGDLSRLIDVDAKGELLDLKNTVNGMVIRLRLLAAEVTRVTMEVGSYGKLGGQVNVPDASGIWSELVKNVNTMSSSLTNQVRAIAIVTTAVAKGDLTQKIEIPVEGEMATLKVTVNNMVDQLQVFATEVIGVALNVGTNGSLGGQIHVEGVQGTWAELTGHVNKMASNLTNQVRSISEVAKAVAQGDVTRFIEVDAQGEMLDLKLTINSMVTQLSAIASEVANVSLEAGTKGILGCQAHVPDVQGEWKMVVDNVNSMAMNITNQIRSIAEVTKAVANGDLTRRITIDVKGEFLDLKETVNYMTESLSVFADEVTRVAREVGTEGKLGGQAKVTGVAGTWKALTDNVNVMASNLTMQVRTIAVATIGVAKGDLTRKISSLPFSGEMANIVYTINGMIDRLVVFTVEVKAVTRGIEIESDLPASFESEMGNIEGIWQEIALSVNDMARNLTSQIRHLAQVGSGNESTFNNVQRDQHNNVDNDHRQITDSYNSTTVTVYDNREIGRIVQNIVNNNHYGEGPGHGWTVLTVGVGGIGVGVGSLMASVSCHHNYAEKPQAYEKTEASEVVPCERANALATLVLSMTILPRSFIRFLCYVYEMVIQ
ncbi:histidine kinase osmosensor [Stygiomarasmius scandens]|uniref:Histidine kinase osmosensor n=1 Tax=Marasmiellus scandens TaxID=2682957 RepID=A0ABR1J1V9_9AGAR